MAGYSGKSLAAKLGIKEGARIYVANGPDNYQALLGPLPEGVTFVRRLTDKVGLIHLFTKQAADLAAKLKDDRRLINPDAVIWVSWPKRAAKVPTDVTEDVVREVALPLGLVDTKVCAVDEVWSGLKLVIRLANR